MTIEINDNPKVSVIVPVYKAEAYLDRCVESLRQQTFNDFEVILVDDGSPDRSGELCDSYVERDHRVRVIHQQNAGVSMARQKGLDNARGEYVIHADPDDWVEPDMLELLYAKAKAEDADMVICDFYVQYENHMYLHKQQPSALDHDTVQCELFQQLHGSCWNKLVRRVCYNQFNIKFPIGVSYCEDLLTNATLLKHDIKVTYLPKAFYHYDQTINPNSIVRRYTQKSFEDDVRLANQMAAALKGSAAEARGTEATFYGVLIRAFTGHAFSSKEFKEKLRPYRKYSLRGKEGCGLYLLLSCWGAYQLMYHCWYAETRIEKVIKQTIKTLAMNVFGIRLGGGRNTHSLKYAYKCPERNLVCNINCLHSAA